MKINKYLLGIYYTLRYITKTIMNHFYDILGVCTFHIEYQNIVSYLKFGPGVYVLSEPTKNDVWVAFKGDVVNDLSVVVYLTPTYKREYIYKENTRWIKSDKFATMDAMVEEDINDKEVMTFVRRVLAGMMGNSLGIENVTEIKPKRRYK